MAASPRSARIFAVRSADSARPDPLRFLTHAACTDTYHDFHKKAGFSDKVRSTGVNPGVFDTRMGLNLPDIAKYSKIPQNKDAKSGGEWDIDALHDESDLLVETFRNVRSREGHPFAEDKNIIQSLIRYLQGDGGNILGDQKIDGLWDETNENLELRKNPIRHTYNIKLFKAAATAEPGRDPTDIKNVWSNVGTPTSTATQDEIVEFFGNDDLFFVFDASVLDLMTFIKSSASSGRVMNVHRIFNREVVNDPATKTYEDSPLRPELVKSDVYFDNETSTISYKRHSDVMMNGEIGYIPKSAILHRDKLFSKYDFNLGPLNYQSSGAPRINLELQDGTGARVHGSADPHEDNNIAKCWKRLLDVYKKDSKHINAAAHLHCKRSGDWLQALSCLDTARSYNNAPRAEGSKRGSANNVEVNGQNLILVTHDRVLLAYALTLGIDVVMTYKWTEDGIAGAAAAAAPDEDGEEGMTDNQSTRHILFFRNSVRDTPDQKRKVALRQIALADYYYKLENPRGGPSLRKDYIDQYNTWIGMIRSSADNTIETAIAQAAAANNIAAFGKAISNLLKAYIRYTSIDYTLLNKEDFIIYETAYSKMRAGVVRGGPITDDISDDVVNRLAGIAGVYNVQVSSINNRMNRIESLDNLIAANGAYKGNPLYAQPVTLTSVLRDSAGQGVIRAQMLETISFLTQRLPVDMYGKAITVFREFSETKPFLKAQPLLYGIFLANLVASAPTAALEAPTDVTDEVKREGITAMEDEITDLAASEREAEGRKRGEAATPETNADDADQEADTEIEATDAEAAEIAAAATAAAAADEKDEVTAERNETANGINPSTERTRKVYSVVASIGTAIKRMNDWIARLAGGGGAVGGGRVGGGQPATGAEFLVKVYFRELYFSLAAYESEGNFDYDYYKTIATIAVPVSQKYKGDWVKQQAFFYDELPKMDFKDIYPKENQAHLRYNLNMAATTLALNSLDRSSGPIPSMGFAGIGSIPLAETLAYNRVIRVLPFEEQRDTLIAAVKAAILVPAPIPFANLARNREARNRTRKAAAVTAPVQVPVNSRTIGHVLGDGSRPSDVIQNDWLVRASAQRDSIAAARAAEHARWVADAQQAPPAPGRYGTQEGLRIRAPRGGDKRTKRRPRKNSKRGRTYKSRSSRTRKLSRRSDR